ncbi:YadA-like family protein [Avibacterium avium]|uniref:Autotransporter adhesin n=1 Tax=Avibacterium avium TaxID=751 RepID=A0A379AT40_AVIAV|nr:YadA-like family protein [Avibacterium avium]SUB24565.1 autotransporter adhesin [Avibacterium avium]
MNNDLFKADFKRDAKHAMSSIEISQHILSYKNLKKLNRALAAILPTTLPILFGAVSLSANATINDTSTTSTIAIAPEEKTATASGDSAIAIGESASSAGDKAVAVGKNANAAEEYTIAVGSGAAAKKIDAVAIGRSSADNTGAVAIGKASTSGGGIGGIAIGYGALAPIYRDGETEKLVAFGRTGDKYTGGIAIGTETHARVGTIDIGNRDYRGEMGDFSTDKSRVDILSAVGATTVGDNSFNSGQLAVINGAYSSITRAPLKSTGGWVDFFTRLQNKADNAQHSTQGFGATILGSLNSIESSTDRHYVDGMASSIVGVANRSQKSNGALIFGAGNEITNSYLAISMPDGLSEGILGTSSIDTVKKMADKFRGLATTDSSGSVSVIGGGNKANYALFSQVSGVRNKLIGSGVDSVNNVRANSAETYPGFSAFSAISGYENIATNVSHTNIMGSHNEVTNATENIVMGNHNKVIGENTDQSQAKRNVLLGFQDKDADKIGKNISNNQLIGSDITVKEGTKNGVLIGDQAEIAASNVDNTTALDGAVAMGAKSVANRQAIDSASVDTSTDQIPENDAAKTNKVYALKAASDADKAAVKKTVKGNLAAVSVGNANNTRQIINVAAGSADTDAVNVAQLRSVATHYYHVNTTGNPNYNNDGATGKNSMAAGKVTASGENSLAVGIGAAAKNINSISIGKTNIYGDNAIGLGSGYAAAKNAIVIGNGAVSDNMGPLSEEGIAIGTNAKSLDSYSTQPRTILGFTIPSMKPNALPNGVGGIAIGANTYANQGTIDIGMKKATGPHPAAPSKTIVGSEGRGANRRAVTSVGTESYAAAHFSSIFGSYSSITSDVDVTYSGLPTQGFASSITGTLNTIKANSPSTQPAAAFDGMANAINGTANVIEHSNGALIMGAGNKISNSLLPVSISGLNYSMASDPEAFNKKLNTPDSNGVKPALASVGIFGGANEVDNSHYVNVSGVDNQLKGAEDVTSSEFVSIDGYMNRATNVKHLSEQGSHNEVTNAEENIVMGNYNKVLGDNVDRSDAKRNVMLGFQDKDADKIGKNLKHSQVIGSNVTVAENTSNGVLIGDDSHISSSDAIAIGHTAQALANKAISIGTGNVVTGEGSGAIGDPSTVSGTGSYSIGNNNTVATNNSFVLGSNVSQTIENSVALGKDSAMTAGSAVGTAVKATDGTDGETTTAGDKGTVETATVNGVPYGGFAGATADGVVSVGSAGKERRVQNVAAGEISETSTDAINGSQLYLVAKGLNDQMPVVYTKADGTKVYKKPDGTFVDESGTAVQPTDVIASMNNGKNSTTTPMELTNIAGNLAGAKTNTTAPVTSGTAPAAEDVKLNNAATVGDVLNAGWNLQGNGQAVDFVKPYDTVNFVDGANTTVSVTTADNLTNEIRVNVTNLPISYTNEAGDILVKVGDKFYKANDVVDGKPKDDAASQTAAGTTLVDSTGAAAPQTLNNVQSAINPDSSKTGDAFTTALNEAGTNSPNKAVNVSDLKNATTTIIAKGTVYSGDVAEDNDNAFTRALGEETKVIGGVTDKANLSDNNIGVVSNGTDTLTVKLAKDLKDLSSATFGTDDKDQTVINKDGITVKGDTSDVSLTNAGLDNGGNKIVNVAPGTADTDAVNVSQLNAVKTDVSNIRTDVNFVKSDLVNVKGDVNNVKADVNNVKADVTGVRTELNDVRNDVNTVKTDVNNVKIDMNNVKNDVTNVKNDMNTVKTDVAGVKTDVTNVKNDMNTMKVDMTNVKNDVNNVKGDVTTIKTDVTNIKTDVAGVKTDVTNVKNDMTTVKTDVAGMKTDVTNVKNDMNTMKVDMTNVKNDVNNVKGDVTNIKTDVAGVKTDMNNVKTDVNNIKTDVNNVKGDVTNVKNQVESITHTTWNLSANDKDKVNIGTADTVNFENTDNNIKIVKSKKENNKVDVDMTLNDTVNIKEKVNVGGTTGASINKDGLTTNGGKGPSVTTVGVNAGNQVITNVAAGVAPTDAVNVSQLDSVRNQLNNVINTNWSMSVNDESPETVARTDTVNFNNSDNNIKLVKTRNGNKINVDMKLNDTVRIGGQNGTVINNHGIMTNGGNGPSITTSGVNAGNKRITNVAAGVAPTDAVNVSQLNGVKRQIDDVDKSARAGIAGALATANLYQAYLPGHSMVSVGVGTFRGQNAIAIGASRLSDNGHIGVKLSGMTTSQGDVGGAMTVGYQW